MTSSKINRSDIGEQLLTTLGSNHFETKVFDGRYIDGEHIKEHGGILQDSTPDYRLFYSFDGIGIDIIEHNIHIILCTSNYGTPFDQYTWHFIGQNAIRQVFSDQTVSEDDSIHLPNRMRKNNDEVIATFTRHINRILSEDFKH